MKSPVTIFHAAWEQLPADGHRWTLHLPADWSSCSLAILQHKILWQTAALWKHTRSNKSVCVAETQSQSVTKTAVTHETSLAFSCFCLFAYNCTSMQELANWRHSSGIPNGWVNDCWSTILKSKFAIQQDQIQTRKATKKECSNVNVSRFLFVSENQLVHSLRCQHLESLTVWLCLPILWSQLPVVFTVGQSDLSIPVPQELHSRERSSLAPRTDSATSTSTLAE